MLAGFLPARQGKLLPAPAPQSMHQVDGMRFSAPLLYIGQYGTPKLLYNGSDGYFYSATIGFSAIKRDGKDWITCTVGTPTKPGLGYIGSLHAGPIRWWSAVYQNEMYYGDAISGGIRRYYIDSLGAEKLYDFGLPADGAPSLAQGTTGSLTLLGTYTYFTVAVDELGRESSPSPTTAVTLTGANDSVTVTRGSNTNGGETGSFYWRVYRKNPNGSVYYRVSQSDIAAATTTYTDNAADTTVVAYQLGPQAGENDQPAGPKCAVMWKNRLVIADASNPFRIKLSNYARPTQFSALASPSNAEIGGSIIITSTYGDEIKALVPFGSVLGVFTRHAFFTVSGDDPSSWRVRQVHSVGCNAPGTVVSTGSVCYWANADGVYRMDGGFVPQKISEDIEADLLGWRVLPSAANGAAFPPEEAAASDASAFWMDHRYYMSYAGRQWVFDELTDGWALLGWGDAMVGVAAAAWNTGYTFAVMAIAPAFDRDPYWFPNRFDYPSFFFLISNNEVHGAWPHGPTELNLPLAYKSRPFDAEGAPRSFLKRPERYIAWGSYNGAALPFDEIGTLTLSCDGQEEQYPIYPPDEEMVSQGRLIEQETNGILFGEVVSVKLELDDRLIDIGEQRLEYTPLN